MPVRVLIADDHSVVRQGLQMILGMDPALSVVGLAQDGAEAVEMAYRLRPDVVLMDILMPGTDGLAATVAIRRDLPCTQVLILSSVLDDHAVCASIRAGAVGYLLKTADGNDLRRAVREAASGVIQLAPAAAEILVREIREPARHETPLTEREREVLRWMAHGLPNKEVARRLHLSETTVKSHVKSILAKLDVCSRTQAVAHAFRTGLLDPEVLHDTLVPDAQA